MFSIFSERKDAGFYLRRFRRAVEVRARNLRFHFMSREDRRIAIIRDALAQVRAKQYSTEELAYLHSDEWITYPLEDLIVSGDSCFVCARGALFLSNVRCFDKYDGVVSNDLPFEKETEYFAYEELAIVEAAFEGFNLSSTLDHIPLEDDDAAYPQVLSAVEAEYLKYGTANIQAYSEDFPSREDRLIAILENMLDNGGVFIPSVQDSLDRRPLVIERRYWDSQAVNS